MGLLRRVRSHIGQCHAAAGLRTPAGGGDLTHRRVTDQDRLAAPGVGVGVVDHQPHQLLAQRLALPLAQGLLTDKYLSGIPEGSRASKAHGFLKPAHLTDDKLAKVNKLNEIAKYRGQTLAQMALAWVLRHEMMTSVLIGASKVEQIEDAVGTLNKLDFSSDELQSIETILNGQA